MIDHIHLCMVLFLVFEKVADRSSWRAALENGNYDLLSPESKENQTINGEEEPMEIDENNSRVKDRSVYLELTETAFMCYGEAVFKLSVMRHCST